MKKSTAINNIWIMTLTSLMNKLFDDDDADNPASVCVDDILSLYELCLVGTGKLYTTRAEFLVAYLRQANRMMDEEIESQKVLLAHESNERKRKQIKEIIEDVEATRNQCVKICNNLEEKIKKSKGK